MRQNIFISEKIRVLCVLGALVVGAISSSGCGPDFAPYWRAKELRVLAIQADPVVLDGGEVAKLRVLAHHAPGDEVEYTWEWCPFRVSTADAYECPVTVESLNAMLRQQAEESGEGTSFPELPADFFELGTGEEVDFAYPATPALIRGFCEAILAAVSDAAANSPLSDQIPVLTCDEGFDISIRLVATSSDDEIISRKRMKLSTGPATPKNLNPGVTGIDIKLAKAADFDKARASLPWVAAMSAAQIDEPTDGWHSIAADEPTPILAGIPFIVRSVVDPMSVEIWTPPAPDGSDKANLEPELEVLLFRWFVSDGDLETPTGLYVDQTNTLLEAGESEFRIPYDPSIADYDGDGGNNGTDKCAPLSNPDQLDTYGDGRGDACDIYLWSVVRDGRLGQDFVERKVRVVGW